MGAYNLTPIGPTWTKRHRALEIVGQTIGLLTLRPLLLVHRALSAARRKDVGDA